MTATSGTSPALEKIGADKTEIRPLNGLRGIAALTVALAHYSFLMPMRGFLIFGWADSAVDLFFCLSGFTMCLAYRAGELRGLAFRNYLVARIARIYPLYLLTLVLSRFVKRWPPVVTSRDYDVIVWDYVRQLTMTNTWSFISSGTHWNAPAWSVSVEFFCYLFVFPVLFYMSARLLRRDWVVRLICAAVVLTASYLAFVYFWDVRAHINGRDPRDPVPEIGYAVNLIRGVLIFISGWVIYTSFLSRDRLWEFATRYADVITLAVLVLLIGGVSHIWPVQLMMLGFPLLILGASSGSSFTSKVLSTRPAYYMGDISYSVYMLHMPWALFLFQRTGLFSGTPPFHLSSSIILFGGMLGLAAFSYHAIEMPLRRVIRAVWQTPAPNAARHPTGGGIWGRRRAVLALGATVAMAGAWRAGIFHGIPRLEVGVGEEITRYPTFERVEAKGWSPREDWGIWSVGRESELVIPLARSATGGLRLSIKGSFFLNERHPTLTARLTVNDIEIGVFTPTLADNAIDASLALPAAALPRASGPLRIKLWIDSPASPASVGLSDDTRPLGFGLRSLKLLDDGATR